MIDWNTIDTVLLDLDGTLLDLHFDNYFWLEYLPKRYAEYHRVDINDARASLTEQITRYHGTLQWYCLDHWSSIVRMDIPALKSEIAHKIQVRPQAEAFLQALQLAKKKVILVTNAHQAGLSLKLSLTGIDRWFDHIVSSHDYQEPKENERFWQNLNEQYPFVNRRTLFIDDTERILNTAKEFGIAHLAHIAKPDLQKPAKFSELFINIEDFSDIMPAAATSNGLGNT